MYNVGYKLMSNLDLPSEEAPVKNDNSMGLLARNVSKTSTPKKEQDAKQRVANYVAQIRKARMELNND